MAYVSKVKFIICIAEIRLNLIFILNTIGKFGSFFLIVIESQSDWGGKAPSV